MKQPTQALYLIALALPILLGTAAARAQDVAPDPAGQDPDTEVARRHFQRGTEFYGDARYEEAVREFLAAREARPLPAFDYNIARCYDRLGRWADAIAAYERYLATVPLSAVEPEDVSEVRTRLAALRRRMKGPPAQAPASPAAAPERPPVAPAVTVAPPPPAARPDARLRSGALALAGLAVGTAALGAILVGSIAPRYAELEEECRARPCTASDTGALRARAITGYALWGLAGTAALADVVLWVLDARARRDARRIALVPAGASLVLRGRF